MNSEHGFLRRMRADIGAIIVYVLMVALYGEGLLWWGLDGAWLFLALVFAYWPASYTRRAILGETDD